MREVAVPDSTSDAVKTVTLSQADIDRMRYGKDARYNDAAYELGNLFRQVLKQVAHNQDPTHKLAGRLMSIKGEEMRAMAQLREAGKTYRERVEHLRTLPSQEETRRLLLRLGLAYMLTQGDWDVDRESDTVTDNTGFVSLERIQTMQLHFYQKHGYIVTEAPLDNGTLIAFDVGCGNGVTGERLNRSEEQPFNNGRTLLSYWSQYGMGDRIYWTLPSILTNHRRPEYQKDKGLNEMIELVCILLNRRIYFSRQFGVKKSSATETLLKLPSDPNLLREILSNLTKYIPNFEDLKVIKADQEFIQDMDLELSEECLAKIAEYCKNPEEFIGKHFEDTLGISDAEAYQSLTAHAQAKDLYLHEIKANNAVLARLDSGQTQAIQEMAEILSERHPSGEVLKAIQGIARIVVKTDDLDKSDAQASILKRIKEIQKKTQANDDVQQNKPADPEKKARKELASIISSSAAAQMLVPVAEDSAIRQNMNKVSLAIARKAIQIAQNNNPSRAKRALEVLCLQLAKLVNNGTGAEDEAILAEQLQKIAIHQAETIPQEYEDQADEFCSELLGLINSEGRRIRGGYVPDSRRQGLGADITYGELSQRRKEIRERKKVLQQLCREADEEIERCLGILGDLSNDIEIFPHNVVIGDFAKFGEIFPERPFFHNVRDSRSISHADDELYQNLMRDLALRYQDGALHLGDGLRESYTRYERLAELWHTYSHLNNGVPLDQDPDPDYQIKVHFIPPAEGEYLPQIRSTTIDKALYSRTEDRKVFFSDEDQYGKEMTQPGIESMDLGEFMREYPQVMIRCEIIRDLKEILVDTPLQALENSPEDLSAETRFAVMLAGRMAFRGLHGPLNEIIESEITSIAHAWKRRVKHLYHERPDGQEAEEVTEIKGKIWEKLLERIPRITQRIEDNKADAQPLKRNYRIKVYPPTALPADLPDHHPALAAREYCVKRSLEAGGSPLPTNLNIPTLENSESLRQKRFELQDMLDEISAILGRPALTHHEFDTCFTNKPMQIALSDIVGREGERYEVKNVKLAATTDYPDVPEKGLVLVGGSLNDVYDEHGGAFKDQFTRPLLEAIGEGDPLRALNICFGSQAAIQAIGEIFGFGIDNKPSSEAHRTILGALQFGLFPVTMNHQRYCDVIGPELSNTKVAMAFTRSGHSIMPDIEAFGGDVLDIGVEKKGLGYQRDTGLHLAPPIVSMFAQNGHRAIACQPHPELCLSQAPDRHLLRQFLQNNSQGLNRKFRGFRRNNGMSAAAEIYNRNINIEGRNRFGKVHPWVQRDVRDAFMIQMLHHQAKSLLAQLRGSTLAP